MVNFLLYNAIAVFLGFILDLIFGDPSFLYHPVIFIGKHISYFEKILRKIFKNTKAGLLTAGAFEVFFVILLATSIPFGILFLCYKIHIILYIVVSTFMCYQILATKCLKDAAMKIYESCKKGDVEEARYNVSMIVGRDTKDLSIEAVERACIESVAESSSDGVIAPMFYMFLGGPILGFFYKSINTMDSMIAYKNEKYLYFGRVAAKMDDLFNLIPARISGLLIVLSSGILKYDMKNSWKIFKRDRYKHESPNSAQTESAMAGALDIRLAGDAVYEGVVCKKDYLGDFIKEVEADDIKKSCKILYLMTFINVVIVCSILLILWVVLR